MVPRAGRGVRLVDRSVRRLAFIGGLALLWLMGLTVVAVMMRYVFGAPILGAQDISEMSLVLVAFLGLAYSGWTGAHIAVDLIGGMLPPGLTKLDGYRRAVDWGWPHGRGDLANRAPGT